MAHNFSISLLGVQDRCKQSRSAFGRFLVGRPTLALFAFPLLLLTGMVSQAQTTSPFVPPIVVSSISAVPTTVFTKANPPTGTQTNVLQPISVALDSCANIYVFDPAGDQGKDGQGNGHDLYTQIPAGGGTANVVEAADYNYWPQKYVGNDPTGKNLILGAGYNNHIREVPLVGCVPQPSQTTNVGGQGPGPLFYYYLAQDAVGDFAGNTYISTSGVCCITGSYYLIESIAGGEAQILLANQPKEMYNIAADKQQNVYFVAGPTVYQLLINTGPAAAAQPYAATPVPFGSFNDPVGLSFDPAGNLYVADNGTNSIYEIPYEVIPPVLDAKGNVVTPGRTGIYLPDQFVVSSRVDVDNGFSVGSPAVSARGDVYYIDPKEQFVTALTLGNANFNAVPIGTTATRTVSFQFNATETPASVQLPTGVFSSAAAPSGTVPCSATTYPYNIPQKSGPPVIQSSCQITIAFTPITVGQQTSSVALLDANGNPLATAYLEGVGQGPLVTVDPGTVAPLGSGFKSPAGVAIDSAGNTFIADASANAITEIPVGGGAPVSLAVQAASTPLSGPLGVALDGAGNLYVADTGNGRVLQVPFLKGAYSASAAVVIASGLKSPSSVFVKSNGDVYVADTGDNTIVLYPNTGLAFGAPQNIGVGLNAPLAVTGDAFGSLYIADSGNNQIVEFPQGGGQETVFANILNPSALTVDSSGSLFAVDQGNFRVLRIPSVNGTLDTNAVAEVGLGIVSPYGVALDSAANLYVTDQSGGAAYTIARSQVALSFGDFAVGTSSGPLPLTVESAGNQPLVFGTPYFTETGNAADFAMTSPTGTCADGVILAAGTSCDLATNFTPSASGSRTATIAFTANDAVPANVTLSGVGVAPAATTTKLALNFAPGPNAPFYGEVLNFVATVAPAGSATPTGNVSFVIDGVQAGLLPLVAGVATLPLNTGLSGGAHSVYAVYKGDTANNGSESAALAVMIARAPTATTLAVTDVPFNNPYSLRHSNAGSCENVGSVHPAEFQYPVLQTDPIGFKSAVTSPGVGVPSGTLTFYSDGHLINGPATSPTGTVNKRLSVTTLLPASGGLFTGSMSSDADTLGDGDMLGENNVLIGPHTITVVYSGDTNYLPSTSDGTLVTVVDVSPSTPITLPNGVEGQAPYCAPNSTIAGAAPSAPGAYNVTASTNTIPVSAGAPGHAILTLSSLGNWGGPNGSTGGTIVFSCPDLPKYTTCTTNPGVVSLFTSTPGQTILPTQVTLTITTNVPTVPPTAAQSTLLWPAAGILGLVMLAMRRRIKRIQTGLALFGLTLLLIGGVTGLSSCGAGTKNIPNVVTPAGSYPITVVMIGAQPSNNFGQDCSIGCGDTEETMKPDLPYTLPFTLVVK